jgi:hypothetical protein
MSVLLDLVSTANTYAQTGRNSISIDAIEEVARWITRMLRMLGLGEGEPKAIGWGEKRAEGQGEGDVSAFFIFFSLYPKLFSLIFYLARCDPYATFASAVFVPRRSSPISTGTETSQGAPRTLRFAQG